MINDGLNFLVQETLNYVKTETETENLFPESCGLLFYVNKSMNTFSLRLLPARNIRETHAGLLKTADHENEFFLQHEKLSYFETNYYEVAEIMADQIGNRRFPIYEEDLFNVSDPGNSWWMKEDSNGMKIFFKSHALGPKNDLLKIGPLGDLSVAQRRFPELVKGLKTFIHIESCLGDDKFCEIAVSNESLDFFKEFKKIFTLGAISPEVEVAIKAHLNHSLYYYLQELAHLRRFWILGQSLITQEAKNLHQ
jgi:hypothetical protein